MLDLLVVPERSLGNEQWEIILGMTVCQAVKTLKSQNQTIRSVQILYNQQEPLLQDIVIDLSENGIRYKFDAITQRLKIIEIYDLTKVKLRYGGSHFNLPENIPPTYRKIEESFGATFLHEHDQTHQRLVLSFRGISFMFPTDANYKSLESRKLADLDISPEILSLIVSRIFIYSGSKFNSSSAPDLPISCYDGHTYAAEVLVVRNSGKVKGLRFNLSLEVAVARGSSELSQEFREEFVPFGSSCEDVIRMLGTPCKVFSKDEDKMVIHDPSPHKLQHSYYSDYFFNYFTLGVDVLFDAESHTAKKFVLHTNVPGHYDFEIYHRCNFIIKLKAPLNDTADLLGDDEMEVTPSVKWNIIQTFLNMPDVRPVVLNRPSSTNTINPFGPTFCYVVEDIIFEVMANGYIASITLFQSD
ncbi:phagosome assembly factor 1-like isoform X2 [Corticium candelabrum]|uniref:phagosome assembly factor 1-like isoform X2 n=1 Tax=Corticium candelabrum TaxID=121492 RepID=UPI002E261AD6|nr:phagosome assembly factor 1-like isoform X2 [Corticium candelabrum]